MKIGILTYHYAHNYGAILQCYALQYALKKDGHEVFVIDYKNKIVKSNYKIFNYKRYIGNGVFDSLKRSAREITLLLGRIRRYIKFQQFICHELNIADEKSMFNMDLIVIGSDQVWNNTLTGGLDSMYWGNFGVSYGGIIASYAASMQDNWDNSLNEKILNNLKNFNYVSVREKSLKQGLSSIGLGKSIDVVADPTLLLSSEDWNAICQNSQPPCDEYVFLYMAEYSQDCYMLAKKFAENHNINLKVLTSGLTKYDSKDIRGAGPIEFLNLIKNARYVLCSSFHGTVFSILYNKPFVTLTINKNKNNRVLNLLSELGISDRIVQNDIDSLEKVIDVSYCVRLCESELYTNSFIYLKKICNCL